MPWVDAVVLGGCALLITSLISGREKSGSSDQSEDQGRGLEGLS